MKRGGERRGEEGREEERRGRERRSGVSYPAGRSAVQPIALCAAVTRLSLASSPCVYSDGC